MISIPFPLEFRGLKKTRYGPTDGLTDGPTDGRTDRPSYRDAWTHLKSEERQCLTRLETVVPIHPVRPHPPRVTVIQT